MRTDNTTINTSNTYNQEILRQNFNIDSLLYLKYTMLSVLHNFERERDYFRMQAEEAVRKRDTSINNINVVKSEIDAIESIIVEKQTELKAKNYRQD